MPKVLIAGCGFLGEFAAGLFLARGWEVVGMRRRLEDGQPTAFEMVSGDLADLPSLRQIANAKGSFDAVVHSASSGRGGEDAYRSVYLEGIQNLVATFPGTRLIFTGSTSVYAQVDGEWVDEQSPAVPLRETGRILLEAEQATLSAGGVVARLAGIYGPGRSVLTRRFLEGTAVIEEDGARWINQIHRDDAAAALVHLVANPALSGVYNVVDDTPATQRTILEWLSDHYNQPLPPTGPRDLGRKRGWTNKRVSNQRLRSTGWTPRWPSFRDALLSGTLDSETM